MQAIEDVIIKSIISTTAPEPFFPSKGAQTMKTAENEFHLANETK